MATGENRGLTIGDYVRIRYDAHSTSRRIYRVRHAVPGLDRHFLERLRLPQDDIAEGAERGVAELEAAYAAAELVRDEPTEDEAIEWALVRLGAA